MQKTMKVNGLTCEFNMPDALKSRKNADGTEQALGLPPHATQPVYVVDEYPACPPNWMHGSDKASSYVVAIKEGKGMWLDFNGCRQHTHDIAIVVSVQGVNSVTGQPTIGGKFHLEQYGAKCPKHGCEFQQDRFCPECKHKWPAQNYLATTGTPHGMLWLDGFRSGDGVVRQYIFSPEEARGVAFGVLDKDKTRKEDHERVYAIGIAFFRSKEAKPKPPEPVWRSRGGPVFYSEDCIPIAASSSWTSPKKLMGMSDGGLESFALSSPSSASHDSVEPQVQAINCVNDLKAACAPTDQVNTIGKVLKGASPTRMLGMRTARKSSPPVEQVKITQNYEVAAGARINQEVYPDPKDISYWEEEPVAFLFVNYAAEEKVAEILAAGRRAEEADGFLGTATTVGND